MIVLAQVQLYLNSSDFVTGDLVNETPRLTVLLEDADGINTVGNGIGHDLIAVIDGEASMTYTLNDYYVSDLGDYTRGMVSYVLPELTEGKHSLMFRAWDMMNNATTVTVDFEVVKGLRPRILEVGTTHSPAYEHTTFLLAHDRPETEVIVEIEVFDFRDVCYGSIKSRWPLLTIPTLWIGGCVLRQDNHSPPECTSIVQRSHRLVESQQVERIN